MTALRDALGFLTVLPVRSAWPLSKRAIAAFPLAGLVLGISWAGAAWAGWHLGGPLVAAAFVLAVDFALTGGLHLDGTADTADGLASRRSPEGAREVMKDPRIGAVGAAALGTVLIVRFALLSAVIGSSWWVIALVPVVGRLALVWQLRMNAPREGSLAAGPAAAATTGALVAASLVTSVCAVAIGALLGSVTAVLVCLASVALGIVVAHMAARRWARRLGPSGDTIGAGGVLAETVALVGLTVL